MKKRRNLSYKVIKIVDVLVAFIVVFICIGFTIRYTQDTIAKYHKEVFSLLRTASEFIDGDTINGYFETNEKDAYYDEVLKYLRSAQIGADVKYFYVFVPLEDEVVYIWDADNNAGYCELGEHEDYMSEESRENAKAAFTVDAEEEMVINRDPDYGFIASGCYPIYDSNGNPVALVAVDIAMEGVVKNLLIFLAITLLIAFFVSFVGAAGMFWFIRKKIINPIDSINNAAKDMVDNLESEEQSRIEIKTGDEIEELAASFNQMDTEVRDYIQKLKVVTAEKQRINVELDMASSIQNSMLPSTFPAFPERKEFDIYASMNPAKEVGGDFYDFFLVDDDHLCIEIADVSGKGVPAALFMMASKIIIGNQALMGKSPAKVLEDANNLISSNNENEMFVTVWIGILEISTGKLTAANAGHEYPVIMQPDGKFELYKDKHGIVVGGMEGVKYKDYEVQLYPGSKIFVYTDGVPEATNSETVLYGVERMTEAINKLTEKNPEGVLVGMREAVDDFVKEAEQFDDLTMLCLEYKGNVDA
ncbi:sigma-B regulation protein RsbU (phosphoserine phosphatase) [Lachnospiraceae bacterium NE2001]|nr:sigma-B regulation protein RsbU (phosphoserine phosphatase) [Lachnospiraceae bacterium NE2001]